MKPSKTENSVEPTSANRVALFYKGCPYPAESGLQRRVLELIRGFAESGAQVTLFSTRHFSETPWNQKSINWLRDHGATDVRIYEETWFDHLFVRCIAKFDRITRRRRPLLSVSYTPPGMCWWLARELRLLSPRATVMVYAIWDRLLTGSRHIAGTRIIDTIDLVSVNKKMRCALEQTVSKTTEGWHDSFNEASLNENFYESFDVTPDIKEFKVYDRYDYTVAISENEATTIRRYTEKTRVVYIPMTEEVCSLDNHHDGDALFTMGENVFNRQGCHYFVHRVMPMILEVLPDFHLAITGAGQTSLPPQDHVTHLGFVPDLREVYRHARFLVCPVFGGTGQLIKVVEAMAHGLPVIILDAALKRARVEHGVDGFVARNAQEFSEYVCTLWTDPERCRLMGRAAQKSVTRNFSRDRLRATLSTMFK